MTTFAYGAKTPFAAIMSGNTDLLVIGDSQSVYSADRGQEGLMRHLQPANWCGRIFNAAFESAESGCRVMAPGTNGSRADQQIEDPTGDSEAATNWCPRNTEQITFTGDMTDATRVIGFRHAFSIANGDYKGVDPYIDARMKGWAIHRASNATERIATGQYRQGWYVNAVLQGSVNTTTMGTGGGLEAGTPVYLAAGDYASGDSGSELLELRVQPPSGQNETGDVIQFGGAVMHIVNADNSRGDGLVMGACARGGMDCAEWLSLISQSVWQNWFAATDTGADQTVIMVMLGHNTETSGVFETNYPLLLTRLYDAFVAERGTEPLFLLVAPWASNQTNSMDSGRNIVIKSYAGSNTAIGDVGVVSLWDAFGGADPGMVGLHPGDNTELALVFGELADQIAEGPKGGLSYVGTASQGTTTNGVNIGISI